MSEDSKVEYNYSYRRDYRFEIDATTGRYKERIQYGALNREHPAYIKRSLHRLAVMTDAPIPRTKAEALELLEQAWGWLPEPQREALLAWCCN